jgi:hypothetical protein
MGTKLSMSSGHQSGSIYAATRCGTARISERDDLSGTYRPNRPRRGRGSTLVSAFKKSFLVGFFKVFCSIVVWTSLKRILPKRLLRSHVKGEQVTSTCFGKAGEDSTDLMSWENYYSWLSTYCAVVSCCRARNRKVCICDKWKPKRSPFERTSFQLQNVFWGLNHCVAAVPHVPLGVLDVLKFKIHVEDISPI